MINHKVNILGTKFNNVSMTEAVNQIVAYVQQGKKASVFTPNPEIVMAAYEDLELQTILNKSELVVPDGIGVVIGSRIIARPLQERVAGYDMVQALFERINERSTTVFFYGAKPGVVDIAKEKMLEKYPQLSIVGTQHGYIKDQQNVIDRINEVKPDILLVGLGAPKQEKWIETYKEVIDAKVFIGCGGSFDTMSGKFKRAPKIFIKFGLEWFHRLITQPTRAKRMLRLPLFLVKMIFEGKRYRD